MYRVIYDLCTGWHLLNGCVIVRRNVSWDTARRGVDGVFVMLALVLGIFLGVLFRVSGFDTTWIRWMLVRPTRAPPLFRRPAESESSL